MFAVPSACGPRWVGLESLGRAEGLRRSGLSLLVSSFLLPSVSLSLYPTRRAWRTDFEAAKEYSWSPWFQRRQ